MGGGRQLTRIERPIDLRISCRRVSCFEPAVPHAHKGGPGSAVNGGPSGGRAGRPQQHPGAGHAHRHHGGQLPPGQNAPSLGPAAPFVFTIIPPQQRIQDGLLRQPLQGLGVRLGSWPHSRSTSLVAAEDTSETPAPWGTLGHRRNPKTGENASANL